MEVIFILATVLTLGLVFYLQYRQNLLFSKLIDKLIGLKTEQEKIIEAPNTIPKDDPNLLDLSESFINVPKDLKIEVEGGDSMAPFGEEEKIESTTPTVGLADKT